MLSLHWGSVTGTVHIDDEEICRTRPGNTHVPCEVHQRGQAGLRVVGVSREEEKNIVDGDYRNLHPQIRLSGMHPSTQIAILQDVLTEP